MIMISPSFACIPAPLHLKGPTYVGYTYNTYHMYLFCCCNPAFSPSHSTSGLLRHPFLSFGSSYSLMHVLKGKYISVHSGSEIHTLVHNHMDRPQDAYQSKPNTNNDATTISTAVYFRAEVLNFMAFFSCTFPFSMFEVCATACKTRLTAILGRCSEGLNACPCSTAITHGCRSRQLNMLIKTQSGCVCR